MRKSSYSYDIEDWVVENEMEDVQDQILDLTSDALGDEDQAESLTQDIMVILMNKIGKGAVVEDEQ